MNSLEREMSNRRTHLFVLRMVLLFPALSWAQPSSQVTGLQAFQRSGQTFLTWNEISGTDVLYKVYRHTSPITNIASASYLGQVDQNSSYNKRADEAGLSSHYSIHDLGAPLSDDTGLFVNTATANGNFHYAVLASNSGGTNTGVTLGSNSLNSAANESVGLPEPVLQSNGDGSHYVHWVNFQNTPLLPAMANRPGVTHNFICNNINTGSAQYLNVGLYGGSNDFTSEVDKIDGNGFELQVDDPRPDLFAPEPQSQDDSVNPLNICWYGYGENFSAGQTLTSGNVPNYLQLHIIYLVDWVLRKWPHVDENRVYLTGSSFGGIGALSLGMAFPHVFAAIWANVPRMDLGEPEWDLEYDSPITDRYQTVWGTTEQNLPTPDINASYPDYASTGEGYNVYDRLDQVFIANQNPQVDFPVIITGVGKQDSHVGWHEKPRYIDAMNASRHQLYLYWENTGHKFETTVFDSVYKRTQLLNYRRNLSYPAISDLSINNDPGLGNDLLPGGSVTGESRGAINGFVGWQGSSVIDTPSQYRIKLYLRGGLMDAFASLNGAQTATATITPRRLQNFPRTPNAVYSFENRRASDNVLIASDSLIADANGLVHANNFQISRSGNYLILMSSAPPNEPPNAMASADPTSGVAPLNAQFTGSNSTDGDGTIASYAWSFGDGNTATTANPLHIYNTAGNYSARLIVTDDDGAKDTAFVAIQVNSPAANQPPNAVASANPTSGFAPLNAQFTGSNSTDSDGAIASYAWDFGDGNTATTANPLRIYNTAGNYSARLIVTDDDGAKDTAFVALQVSDPSPGALSTIRVNVGGPQYVSTSGKTFLADQVYSAGSYGYLAYTELRTTASPIANTSDPALYQDARGGDPFNYRFTVPNGAYDVLLHFAEIQDDDPFKRVMDVKIEDNLVIDELDVWVAAGGKNVAYTRLLQNAAVSDGQLNVDFYRTPASTKRKPVVAAIEIGAVGSLTSAPNQPPSAIASANPMSGIAPLNVQFTGSNSTGSDGTIASHAWDFDDGDSATIANPLHTFNMFGNYSVRLIVTDNIGVKDTAFVAIQTSAPNQPPNAIASANPMSGIAPLNTQFTGANSIDSDGTIASHAWDFGDGDSATIANPSHTFNAFGNYSVRLIVTDNIGAKDTAFVAIQVSAPNQPPNAIASANPMSGIAPLNAQFTGANSTDNDGTIASYAWDFGDGDSAAITNPPHTFNTFGNYSARLIVTDNAGALDTAFVQIQVTAPSCIALPDTAAYGKIPGGDQSHVDKVSYCFPGMPGNIKLSYQAFDIDGAFEAELLLNGTRISNVPATGDNLWSGDRFISLPDSLVNNSVANTLVFDNLKNPPSSLLWGVRRVSVAPLTANQPPNAVANANPTTGKAPLTVQFNGASSTDSDGTITNYKWAFKDGTTGQAKNPLHTFNNAGAYNVRLIVTDNSGAKDTAFVKITVTNNAAPNAVASANPANGLAPLNAQFTGVSSTDSDGTIASYAWNFGDGGTSTQSNPQHIYNAAGNYSARLIVTDNAGAKDTAFAQIQVSANQPPNAVASANPTNGIAPLNVQFIGSNSIDSDGTIASHAWNFGDGSNAAQANVSHTYDSTGTFLASLIVTDNLDAKDTAEVTITVAAPTAPATVIRVNAGGGQYTATNGDVFAADQIYSPGSWGYPALGVIKTTANAIANTANPALYQDLHEKGELAYQFDLPNGTYDVILHFVEIADNEANRRVMDVTMEGNLVVNDLDVWVAAGGKYVALRRLITGVVVSDGQLNMSFARSYDVKRAPAVAAIEVGTAGSLSLAKESENNFAEALAPEEYTLEQNYPNPFNPATVITFSLPEAGEVRLAFYNALGQPARKPIVRYFAAGRYKINLNASEWAAGVYFYELKVNSFRALKKMILTK